MARFVIADLTDAKSVLQELREIVPSRPSLPVHPILLANQAEPGMFDSFRMFPWVVQTRYYETCTQLVSNLDKWVIGPAECKATRTKWFTKELVNCTGAEPWRICTWSLPDKGNIPAHDAISSGPPALGSMVPLNISYDFAVEPLSFAIRLRT
jgi:hypothetical protein